jgi:tRNA threonylcarbamoyl adenosine modification protein YjeE
VLPLPGLAATHALAARLAALLRPGDVVAREGALGVGQSELARAAIRCRAGADIEVPSPTFTIVQAYELPDLAIVHADLYRLAAADELLELGLDEALERAALLVEWPERADGYLPADRLTIRLRIVDAETREATLAAGPAWRQRLAQLAG